MTYILLAINLPGITQPPSDYALESPDAAFQHGSLPNVDVYGGYDWEDRAGVG